MDSLPYRIKALADSPHSLAFNCPFCHSFRYSLLENRIQYDDRNNRKDKTREQGSPCICILCFTAYVINCQGQRVILFCLKERSEEHTSELQSRGHIVCR